MRGTYLLPLTFYLTPLCHRCVSLCHPFLILVKYRLTASTVQAATKGLLEKDFITHDLGTYSVYDKFFALWLLN